MRATVGDRIVVRGHYLGEPDRDAEILEVHGSDGTPPYVVRWADDGHVATYVPGPDARVDHVDDEPADAPVSNDLRSGIAAVRADVARLRAATRQAAGLGGDFWRVTSAEIDRAARRVECEATVIWAQVRAAEANSVDAVRRALDDAAQTIRMLYDEARVQANLGIAEADDVWEEVVAGIRRLRDDPGMTLDAARTAATELLARLRGVAG